MPQTFFAANETELWVTNGTVGGAQLVKDLGATYGIFLASVGTIAFFTVTTGSGMQVWRSDGTASGTFAVSGLLTSHVSASNVAVFQGSLYFLASDAAHGSSLFRTAGGAGDAAFVMRARIVATNEPQLVATASHLFFFGQDANGTELWRTDGTAPGTIRLTTAALDPHIDLERVGESVAFMPYEGTGASSRTAPYISDGTVAGTVSLFPGATQAFAGGQIDSLGNQVFANTNPVYDANLGRFVSTLYISGAAGSAPVAITLPGQMLGSAVIGGQIFFYSNSQVNTISGYALYRVTGNTVTAVSEFTINGTTFARDLGDRMIVYASGASGNGFYSFDGTSSRLLIQTFDYNSVVNFVSSNGKLFFTYSPGNGNTYLLVNDGVTPTRLVSTTPQGQVSQVSGLYAVDGGVVFTGVRSDIGSELFFSDGASANVVLLGDLAPGLDHSASAAFSDTATLADGRLLFGSSDPLRGWEPWVSDGTTAGTHVLTDLFPGTNGSDMASPVLFGGWTYFVAQASGTAGQHLFATNGTSTVDLGASGSSFFPVSAQFGTKLYFFGNGSWLEIAAPAGTPVAGDVISHAAPPNGLTSEYLALNGKLLMSTFDGVWAFNGASFTRLSTVSASTFEVVGSQAYFAGGTGLYRTDGTVAGTQLLFSNPAGMPFQHLTALPSGLVLFSDVFGNALWVRSGGMITQLLDFNPGAGDAISIPSVIGGKVYFTATAAGGTVNLWVTDGTAANTQIVSTAGLGPISGAGSGFAVNGAVFLPLWTASGGILVRIDAATNAVELLATGVESFNAPVPDGTGFYYFTTDIGVFRSDGTAAGTTLLLLANSSEVMEMVGGTFYFQADVTGQGAELWRTDGTVAGTVMLTDTAVVSNSNPYGFGTVVNHAPEGVADLAALTAGQSLTTSTRAAGVLGNDADPDAANGNLLTVTAARAGAAANSPVPGTGSLLLNGVYGNLTIAANGTWSYAATTLAAQGLALGAVASDVFSYVVTDPQGGNATTTLTLRVTGTGTALIGTPGDDRLVYAAGSSVLTINGLAGTDTLAVTGSADLSAVTLTALERVELTSGAITLTGAQFNAGLASNTQFSGTGTITVNLSPGTTFTASGMALAGGANVSFTVNGTGGADSVKAFFYASNTINVGGGNDQVRGGIQSDTINGGDGNDKIIGFYGSDILTGGAGADQFRYLFADDSRTGANADRITDFLAGTDRLNFALLDADPVAAGRQALTFIDTAAFTATGMAQVRYGVSGADLLVQVDLDGNGTADMEIVLLGASTQTLTSGDFML